LFLLGLLSVAGWVRKLALFLGREYGGGGGGGDYVEMSLGSYDEIKRKIGVETSPFEVYRWPV